MKLILFLLLMAFSVVQSTTIELQNTPQIFIADDYGAYMHINDQIFQWSKDEKWNPLPLFPNVLRAKWQDIDLSKDIACIDEEGNLWLLLFPQLICYNQTRNNWQIILLPIDVLESHEKSFPLGIEIWRKDIWILTKSFLWCFHRETQLWKQISYPENTVGNILYKDLNNNLWISTTTYFDGKNWTSLPLAPEPIHSFIIDSQGKPWGITKNNLYHWDNKLSCWQKKNSQSLKNLSSIALFNGQIWITNYSDGCYYWNNDHLQKVEFAFARPAISVLRSFYPTNKILWFNTFFGIGIYDGSNWISQQDSTEYYRIRTSFYLIIGCIIIILSINIFFFLLLGRLKKKNFLYCLS